MFEAFSGVGITRLALEDVSNELRIGMKHIGFSEIEPCSIKGYQAIHGNDTRNYGDITKIPWEDVEGVDFLTLPVGKEGMRDGVSSIILGSPGSGKSVFF